MKYRIVIHNNEGFEVDSIDCNSDLIGAGCGAELLRLMGFNAFVEAYEPQTSQPYFIPGINTWDFN